MALLDVKLEAAIEVAPPVIMPCNWLTDTIDDAILPLSFDTNKTFDRRLSRITDDAAPDIFNPPLPDNILYLYKMINQKNQRSIKNMLALSESIILVYKKLWFLSC